MKNPRPKKPRANSVAPKTLTAKPTTGADQLKEWGRSLARSARRTWHKTNTKLIGPQRVIDGFMRDSGRDALWFFKTIVVPNGPDAITQFVVSVLTRKPSSTLYNDLLYTHRTQFDANATLDRFGSDMVAATIRMDSPLHLARLIDVALKLGNSAVIVEAVKQIEDKKDFLQRSKQLKGVLSALTLQSPLPVNVRLGDDLDELLPILVQRLGVRARKRLVVSDASLGADVAIRMAQNAEEVVFYNLFDLYGKMQIPADALDAKISVEHPRSRIHRFSEKYAEIHRRTHAAARQLSALIAKERILDVFFKGTVDWTSYITLEISDALFFRCLRLEALLELIDSDEFDDIVFCFGDNGGLYRVLGALPRLFKDKRIHICSPKKAAASHAMYMDQFLEMRELASDPNWRGHKTVHSLILSAAASREQLDEKRLLANGIAVRIAVEADKQMGRLDRPGDYFGRPLVVANDASTYYSTLLPTLRTLLIERRATLAWQSSNISRLRQDLIQHSSRTDKRAIEKLSIFDMSPQKVVDDKMGKDWSKFILAYLSADLLEILSTAHSDLPLHYALCEGLSSLFSENLVRFGAVARGSLAILEKQRPNVVVLNSARKPHMTLMANAARQMGVPSLTLEAHALNANYCRFARVPTDYIGVPGPYFAGEYAAHYGIERDRCLVIGSPRFGLKPGYDLSAERQSARVSLGLDGTVVTFMTQPLDRGSNLELWNWLLTAKKELAEQFSLVLKCHPEESDDQQRAYVIAAGEAGVHIELREGDPKMLISASDLVVSRYSATLLEAAIIGVPTAVLKQVGEEHPMPYYEIIGCPVAESASDTVALIKDIVSEGTRLGLSVAAFRKANPQYYDDMDTTLLVAAADRIASEGAQGITLRPEFTDDPFLAIHSSP